MKKLSNLLMAAMALAIISLSSCNDVKPQDIALTNLNDSVNYSLGQWQGDVFRQQYFANDSTGKQLKAFIAALDAAYAKEADVDELYELGKQVGKYFKDNTEAGFFGDSTLTGNTKMVVRGMLNAINDYQDVMSSTEADSVVQAAQQKATSKLSAQPLN